jgi:hypothetical protein
MPVVRRHRARLHRPRMAHFPPGAETRRPCAQGRKRHDRRLCRPFHPLPRTHARRQSRRRTGSNSLRGANFSKSITFELSTSSAFSSSAVKVTNSPRAYSYPLTTRRLSISSPVAGSCGRSVTRVAAGLWSPSGPVSSARSCGAAPLPQRSAVLLRP